MSEFRKKITAITLPFDRRKYGKAYTQHVVQSATELPYTPPSKRALSVETNSKCVDPMLQHCARKIMFNYFDDLAIAAFLCISFESPREIPIIRVQY